MNEIQRCLFESALKAIKDRSAELIAGVDTGFEDYLDPVVVARSLVEFESVLRDAAKSHTSEVATDVIYLRGTITLNAP